jgi:hypothetical protein
VAFDGVTLTAAGTANGQTGHVTWTTPAAQATAQSYSIIENFSANTTLNTSPATVTINFSVAGAPSDTTEPTLHLPSNITAEATGASGAVVTYSATADDANPAHPLVTCSPASGSTFALGTTTVNCSATDAVGNTANDSFTVTVQDTTEPVVASHANITAEATGPGGAAVNYTKPTATDTVDGSVAVVCTPSSGSTFALGPTTVICSATDAALNTGSNSFTVTVQDTTPPVLTVPADITNEATSASGASVTFSATASDLVDASPVVTCKVGTTTVTSPHTFPLGTTTVSCTATDASTNTSQPQTFDVTVVDTTPPTLTLPNITTTATSASGATVTYSASANDLVDGAVTPSCSPASGGTFAIGQTTVTCSATDAHLNTATGTFKVSVIYGASAVQFLQPINGTAHDLSTNPDVSTFKAGSTVPAKVQVKLANGTIIHPASAQWITPQKGAATTQSVDEAIYSEPATSGSNYTWDPVGQFNQYNWGTAKNGAGFYWLIGVKLDDGQVYRVYISLR